MHFVLLQICSNVSSTDSPNESRLASLSRQTTQREAKPPKARPHHPKRHHTTQRVNQTTQRETKPPKGRQNHPKANLSKGRGKRQCGLRGQAKITREVGYLRMPASKLLLQPPDTSLQLAHTDHASILCTAQMTLFWFSLSFSSAGSPWQLKPYTGLSAASMPGNRQQQHALLERHNRQPLSTVVHSRE